MESLLLEREQKKLFIRCGIIGKEDLDGELRDVGVGQWKGKEKEEKRRMG